MSNSPIARLIWSTKASTPRCASARSAARISSGARSARRGWCAAHRRLTSKRRGEPRKPEDLAAHACLTYEYAPRKNLWPFRDRRGNDRSVRVVGSGARQQRPLSRGARRRRACDRHRARFHRRSRRARRPARSDPARIRAADGEHLRRLSEPTPFVGQGARVRGFPVGAFHSTRMGSGAGIAPRGRTAARIRAA